MGLNTPNSEGGSKRLGIGCAVVFLLPFALAGLLAGAQGLRIGMSGADFREWVGPALVGLVFSLVGFGGLVGLRVGLLKQRRDAERAARHPDRPWLWREEWADGRVRGQAGRAALQIAIFALLWNGVSWPSLIAGWEQIRDGEWWVPLVAATFPLIGLWLVGWSARMGWQRWRYGVATLELETRPGVVGHGIAGTIAIPRRLDACDGFEAKLVSIRRVNDRESSHEERIWEQALSVPREAIATAGDQTRVPVAFAIPRDAEPSDPLGKDRSWRIELKAELHGLNYLTHFEVPVFRTPLSERPADEGDFAALHGPTDHTDLPKVRSRILVDSSGEAVTIDFPAARNRSVLFSVSLFTLIWLTILAVLFSTDVPWLFIGAWGMFAVLLIAMVGSMLFVARGLRVGREEIAREFRLFGFRWTRYSATDDLEEVEVSAGMRSGSRLFWRLYIVGNDGTRRLVGDGIPDRREADWLAATIEAAANPTASPVARHAGTPNR